MVRTVFALVSLGAAVAIVSCSGGALVGGSPDASGGAGAPSTGVAGTTGGAGTTGVAGTTGAGGTLGTGGSGVGSGGTAGGGSGATCTDLVNDAPPAPVRSHTGDRPASEAGAGGVIVDGIYDLNSQDYYASAQEEQRTAVGTIRISDGGTRMEAVVRYEYSDGASALYKTVRTLAVTGTHVASTFICPDGGGSGVSDDEYTATSTRLMFSNPLWVTRYVRR